MNNAIEIEINRSNKTGAPRVKVVMGDLWAIYRFDYSLPDSAIPAHYAMNFIEDVNKKNNWNLTTDNMRIASTRDGWVVIL